MPTGAARPNNPETRSVATETKSIKCVVWDLDDTLWDGILLEEQVALKAATPAVIKALDDRGILQSIASRNDPETAMAQLRGFGLADYFLVPQIHWGAKSQSITRIAEALNIGIDSFAFVDDQPFEREEVAHSHSAVLCLDGTLPLTALVELPRMQPCFMTADSKHRRRMYQEDFLRQDEEQAFQGTADAFLATLDMHLWIGPAGEGDLQRAEELTERTHQLNSTGYTFSYDQLNGLRRSPDHLLLVAGLSDRFGSYGRIGLALVEQGPELWTLKLLIVSCRVMSRGVGAILLHEVLRRARGAGVRLRAEFRDTGRNRIMNVTYRFSGFTVVSQDGEFTLFEHDLALIPETPAYVTLDTAEAPPRDTRKILPP